MTFWQFIDKQLARVTATAVAGAGIFILTAAVLVIIVIRPDVADSQLFSVLAQAIVVQGLVGLAMASWFTIKQGRDEVEVVNDRDHPVPTEEEI